jgi:hypothetical protein
MRPRLGQEAREPEFRFNPGPYNLSFLERHAPAIAWRDYARKPTWASKATWARKPTGDLNAKGRKGLE